MSLLVRCPDFRGCNVVLERVKCVLFIEVSSFKIVLILSVFVLSQDVVNDIDGAQKVGMKGILVKTGKQINLVLFLYKTFTQVCLVS